MESLDMDNDLTIQEVSDRLGLPKSTLRYWEKEFNGFISLTRTPGGQRRYSDSDMEIITSIQNYKKMGLSLSQIKKKMQQSSMQFGHVDSFHVDQLAKRIAIAVRREIYYFFDQGQQQGDTELDSKAMENDIDH
jgi:DNA-binding transcriptional MerR regulator